MKNLFTVCGILLLGFSLVFGQTPRSAGVATSIMVSDTIKTDTVWSADTVKVTGELTVADSVILTINPGICVEFQGHYKMIVNGVVLAEGTEEDSIVFTIHDTTGFSNPGLPEAGGWHGIRYFYESNSGYGVSKFSYCKFEYGKATGSGSDQYGGALFTDYFDKVEIRNSVFTHNFAESRGGGLNLQGDVLVENTKVSSNQSGQGGGIFVIACQPRLVNVLIADNRAEYYGGGIDFDANVNETEVFNCSVVNNYAGNDGGGIYFRYRANCIVENTLIFHNRADRAGPQVFIGYTVTDPSFRHCNIEGDSAAFAGEGAGAEYSGVYENNLNVDPRLAGTGSEPYSLSGISPCIDTGDTSGLILPDKDVIGNDRVYLGGNIDIGAYEYQGALVVSAPVIEEIADQHVEYDSTFIYQVRADVYPYPTFSLLVNPAGMTIDDTTGIIVWVPTVSQLGTHTVTVQAENSQGSDTETFMVSVFEANRPPYVLNPIADFAFPEDGQDASLNLNQVFADDNLNDHLSFTFSGNDSIHISIIDAVVHLSAQPNWTGTEEIEFTATDDSAASVSETVNITVFQINDPPELFGLPDSIIFRIDNNAVFNIWQHAQDVETASSDLVYTFDDSQDMLSIDYNNSSGDVTLTSSSYVGTVDLFISAADDSGAVDYDTVGVRVEPTTAVSERLNAELPVDYSLSQNFPNPFNPVTTIMYALPVASPVQIEVYNLNGQRVEILFTGEQNPGYYQLEWNAAHLGSGIYYYKITAGTFSQIRKMTLLK